MIGKAGCLHAPDIKWTRSYCARAVSPCIPLRRRPSTHSFAQGRVVFCLLPVLPAHQPASYTAGADRDVQDRKLYK